MALPELTASIDAKVSRVLADGAFDSRGVFDTQTYAFGSQAEVINPPAMNGAIGLHDAGEALIKSFAQIGRVAWRTAFGQNDRALVEAHPLMHGLPGNGLDGGNSSSATRLKHGTSTSKSPKFDSTPKYSTA